MRPIPDRLTPLECWPVHMTRQDKVHALIYYYFSKFGANLLHKGEVQLHGHSIQELPNSVYTSQPRYIWLLRHAMHGLFENMHSQFRAGALHYCSLVHYTWTHPCLNQYAPAACSLIFYTVRFWSSEVELHFTWGTLSSTSSLVVFFYMITLFKIIYNLYRNMITKCNIIECITR